MIRLGACVGVCLMAGTTMAQETSGTQDAPPPETSIAPETRPDPEERVEELEPVVEDDTTEPETSESEDETETAELTPEPVGPSIRETLRETDAEFASCIARLDEYGTVYSVFGEITENDDLECGVARAVEVSEIVPGVTLRPDAKMRCETAAQLAEWMVGSVQPAAELMESYGAVTGVNHGSTYICRRRNNLPDGVLSEHAYGNAIDIMGFTFEDGRSLNIEPRADAGTIEEGFQRAVRGTSCLSFTTVIGPGTDAAHADHLHFDVKERNGGYRICQ